MKERPILFKGEMVRAILKRPVIRLPREVRGDGPFQATRAPAGEYTPLVNPHGAVSVQTVSGDLLGVKPDEYEWAVRPKTQTRRVVDRLRGYGKIDGLTKNVAIGFNVLKGNRLVTVSSAELLSLCPYGQPGDILWVRENIRIDGWYEDGSVRVYYPATDETRSIDVEGDVWDRVCERGSDIAVKLGARDGIEENGEDPEGFYLPDGVTFPITPSLNMPRWACRLKLRIKSVHIERVRDITEDDAHAEGITEQQFRTSVKVGGVGHDEHIPLSYRGAFANLWEHINGKRGYGWEENPWVWVIEFELVNA